MVSYVLVILALGAAFYLRQRARGETIVPLSVWLIPVAVLAAFGAFTIGFGLQDLIAATRSAAPGERPATFAEGLARLLGRGRFYLVLAAAIAALETALAGYAGELQSETSSVWTNPVFIAGLSLAAAVGGLTYWQFESGWLESMAMAEALFVIPPLIVAGSGIGIARTMQRKTPSSFPFAVAGTGIAGLMTFYLGGRFARWEADCLSFLAHPDNALLVGASSPNAAFDTTVLIAVAAAGAASLALAAAGAVLGEKPWKWGTLGDGILFLLVTIVLVSSLGWSWNRMAKSYGELDRMSESTLNSQDVFTDRANRSGH